ncbi:uncharacterized protein F5891DRAFT_982083 [Suillus fuscotomentosus]|uniref:Uncharacterized protein n=1 Tax=Suillus fuscotomentosus TaxID=1912939 RepID=A0AAD4HIT9_9AGAM|nr:uncharacterized protein F5891DRAFT_982083 [Suillus fuscotomentosus]KAG1898183.1 hypothetical protein F5891DRAFT_982083 [Suillus fuscotomentosus]
MARIEEARGSVLSAIQPTQDAPKLQVDTITEALQTIQSHAASKANQPTAGEGLPPEDDSAANQQLPSQTAGWASHESSPWPLEGPPNSDDSATCQRPPNYPANGTVDDILPDEGHAEADELISEDGDDTNNMGGLTKPPPWHQINDSTEKLEFEHWMADNEDHHELMNEDDGPDDADDTDDMIYTPWHGFSEIDDYLESSDQTPKAEEYDGPELINEDNGPDDGCDADDTDDIAYAPWCGFSEMDDCLELSDQTPDDEECNGQMDEGDGPDGGDNANTSPETCVPPWHEVSTFRGEGHTGMMDEGDGDVEVNIEGDNDSEEDGLLCTGIQINLGKSIE